MNTDLTTIFKIWSKSLSSIFDDFLLQFCLLFRERDFSVASRCKASFVRYGTCGYYLGRQYKVFSQGQRTRVPSSIEPVTTRFSAN